MISLLEKEARDPVEVLRIKLKDSTETSLLNSQLLQEIKHDYLRKQDNTKGQLDAFVQAHVDEIERASSLLEMEDTVSNVVCNFESLHQNCRRMNDELGEKKLLSGISIARRNLKDLESQMIFYEELPMKISVLDAALDEQLGEIVGVYTKWQAFDDWRQKILHELQACAADRSDELGNSNAQGRVLASMGSRLAAVEELHEKMSKEVWGCVNHCVQVAQSNRQRLLNAFQVMDLMERRRCRFVLSKRDYLDNSLKSVSNLHTPLNELCKSEITTYLAKEINEMFRLAEEGAEKNNAKLLDAVLDVANQLLMDLAIVQSDVVRCFPTDIDVMHLFTSTYNAILENEISKQCSHPSVGIAERLQLVQWIEYYNSEIVKFKRARASIVLDQTAQMLMSLYLDQIQGQIHMWVSNVWKREEEHVIGVQGGLQSTRPNDIINILKSQISIGQEWLTGKLVGRVVNQCLEALMDQLKARYHNLSAKIGEVDVETLCSFINDADILQAKCPELVEEISFASRDPEEQQAFDIFMGDGLDMTSTEIVKLAAATCELMVGKIFTEVEHETVRLWFSKKWDENEAVVETLLATLEDYYSDIKRWISSSFFFAKVVRQCLDRCAKEYVQRLLIRSHCFSNPYGSAGTVEADMKALVSFFSRYADELKRTGLRTEIDIKNEFSALQQMSDAIRGNVADAVPEEFQEALQHIQKLLRSTSNQEAAETSKKSAKKKKEKSLKGKEKIPKEKEKRDKTKIDKTTGKEQGKDTSVIINDNASRETDSEMNFEVQKLNMADFLRDS